MRMPDIRHRRRIQDRIIMVPNTGPTITEGTRPIGHRWKESIPSTALVANIENSHHLAERGPKIFNTKSEKLVKVDPLIALRDAKDRSEGSSDRVDLERKLNFISKFVASDITRDVTP